MICLSGRTEGKQGAHLSLSQLHWLISFLWFIASAPPGELGFLTTDMHFSSSQGPQQPSLDNCSFPKLKIVCSLMS